MNFLELLVSIISSFAKKAERKGFIIAFQYFVSAESEF